MIVTGIVLFGGCGSEAAGQQEAVGPEPVLAAIESRTGSRLGVAVTDSEGRLLISHRPDERFAMCSTFKLPLAAMILSGANGGSWRLDEQLPFARENLLAHSPVTEQALDQGQISIADAAEAVVVHSDNGAANLLLRRTGGPDAFTSWLRKRGDQVTRLDRYELDLNENRPGDPRDTTSPAAFAVVMADIVYGEVLKPADRDRLRAWTVASRTGARRIRAGLPPRWRVGDKTGTCGTAYNDVAWIEVPNGLHLILTIYLDRPKVSAAEAEAAIADVTRHIVARVR